MRRIVMCLLVLAAAACFNRPAEAQVLYGSIVGTVLDASGAAVPNAAITIIDNSTGQSRAGVTTEDGTYAFTDVPAGSYTLTVTARGFRLSRTTNVQVAINAVSRNDVRLQVGELAETVNVEASAPLIQAVYNDDVEAATPGRRNVASSFLRLLHQPTQYATIKET